MKKRVLIISSALLLCVSVFGFNFLADPTEDFCLTEGGHENNGTCNSKENMPAENGEGTVTVKWCESTTGPEAGDCSGNSMNPQLMP